MVQVREIKFRAWHPQKGWSQLVIVYGDGSFDTTYDNVSGYSREDGVILIQYTGLKDKNGKEIYEGDIVEVKDYGFAYKYIGVVNWDKDSFSYKVGIYKDYSTMSAGLRDIPRTLENHSFEIIGNIYENPELLEGGENI